MKLICPTLRRLNWLNSLPSCFTNLPLYGLLLLLPVPCGSPSEHCSAPPCTVDSPLSAIMYKITYYLHLSPVNWRCTLETFTFNFGKVSDIEKCSCLFKFQQWFENISLTQIQFSRDKYILIIRRFQMAWIDLESYWHSSFLQETPKEKNKRLFCFAR